MILMVGAFLGLFSVAFGAYSEHGLKPVITDEQFRFLMTAVRYNQVNAVVIAAIGFVLNSSHPLNELKTFHWSAKAFVLGSLLFSFSIYFSVLLNVKSITSLTPFGGVTLMIAWILLLISANKVRKCTTK